MAYLHGTDDDSVFVGEYTRLGDDAKKQSLQDSKQLIQSGGGGDSGGIPTSMIILGGAALGLVGVALFHANKMRKGGGARSNPGRRRRRRNPQTKKVAVGVYLRGKVHNVFVDLPVSADGKVRLTAAERERIAKQLGARDQDVVGIR